MGFSANHGMHHFFSSVRNTGAQGVNPRGVETQQRFQFCAEFRCDLLFVHDALPFRLREVGKLVKQKTHRVIHGPDRKEPHEESEKTGHQGCIIIVRNSANPAGKQYSPENSTLMG